MRALSSQFKKGEVSAIFDTVHLAAMAVDPVTEWREHAGCYAHVQLADAPARSMPGTGTLDFAALFGEIARSRYRGYLGAEYWAATTAEGAAAESLAWVAQARAAWLDLQS